MRVLYVRGSLGDETNEPMDGLQALDDTLRIETVVGAAAALVELRSKGEYQAAFLSPRLAANEALALIATLRRDRVPVAIVSIITEEQRPFFAQAMTAGADDVLVLHPFGLDTPKETLRRIRSTRHAPPPAGQPKLRVLYVGQDDLAFDVLNDLPFATAGRTVADPDGTTSLGVGESATRADVIVIDEQPGEGHALRVVKWLQSHAPDVPIVVLAPLTAHDVGGAALELGAADVVSKAGTYRRRLAATLARRVQSTGESLHSFGAHERPRPSHEELEEPVNEEEPVIDDIEERETEVEIEPALPEPVREPAVPMVPAADLDSANAQLEAMRVRLEETQESLAFERTMRARDREEMTRLRQSASEEHERRVVLEETLRHTEDRSRQDAAEADGRHANVLEGLERHVARLQDDLTARTAERDRLIQHELFGWATVTQAGVLVACNTAFARMFGFDDPADAIGDSAHGFAGLIDHAFLVDQLQQGKKVDRVQSVLQRGDHQPFRVLTSAAFLPSAGDEPPLVERMLIDLEDRARLDEQLRLARRLEAAGRLAAEMSAEIEPALAALDDPQGALSDRRRVALLLRQLLAFSRHQAKPAGLLSVTDAVRRAEPLLRQVAGDLAPVSLELEDAGPIAASEDDVEQLLSALAFAAAGCLPYGGALTFRTRTIREGFDQRTELSVTASGYGVLPASISTSLTRLVTKCGGTVVTTDDPARATTLHVYLPC